MNQLFALLELERRRVDAVAQVRRLGAVLENMTKMSVAFAGIAPKAVPASRTAAKIVFDFMDCSPLWSQDCRIAASLC